MFLGETESRTLGSIMASSFLTLSLRIFFVYLPTFLGKKENGMGFGLSTNSCHTVLL